MKKALKVKIYQNFPNGIFLPENIGFLLDFIELHDIKYFNTHILFYPTEKNLIGTFFQNKKIDPYFGTLGTTGDGSILAIWKYKYDQYYVHIGSEGNDYMILAKNCIDFIKLISIGYTHFSYSTISKKPENTNMEKIFQDWVQYRFSINIPENGKHVIALNKSRIFSRWLDRMSQV